MGNIVRFPTVDTFEVKFDMGRWCVVRRRQGHLVERSYWPDRHCAEFIADHMSKVPATKVPAFNDRLPDWASKGEAQ